MTTWIIAIIALIVLVSIYYYNLFVKYKVRVQEALSDIEIQLKRRYDLIPNLVNLVKGYTKYEKSVMENVTKARSVFNSAIKNHDINEVKDADNLISKSLNGLFAVAEAYPDLKASDTFIKLQEELSDTENKIQSARRFYNSVVMGYNTAITTFPGNIFAKIFGFNKPYDFFDIDEAQKKNIYVKI